MDREDGPVKVTGAATYAADHHPDGLAYGYLLTSTVARGTILAMDTAQAEKAPGVIAIYTPFHPLELRPYAKEENGELTPPIQNTDVRYYGQAIGLVVAETFEQARDAAALVSTRCDAERPRASFTDGLPSAVGTSVVDVLADGVSSIDEALDAGDVTVTATYTTPAETHVAMEPHATVAFWTGDQVTVHTATQGVRLVVDRLSETLAMDPARFRVINPYVGGGFGNKWDMWPHTPLTVAAARALGRPVKTVLTREQVFTVVGHRPLTAQTVSLSAARDGTLVAVKNDGVSSKSASNGFHEQPANLSLALYGSANLHVSRKAVTLDVPATTIMRAPGESNGSFALESALDELAGELGMDPVDLRRKNDTPVHPATGLPWSSKHLAECYTVGAERFGWSRRSPRPGTVTDGDWLVGLGMATATYGAGRGQASINVRLRDDGRAVVSGTAADLGTGQSTVFAVLAADRLGIPVGRVVPELGDSATPPAANAGGSGSTSTNGPAVQLAADAAKEALVKLATEHEKSPFHGQEVTFSAGEVRSGGDGMPFGELLTSLGVAAVEATATSPRNPVRDHAFRSFGAHFCEVRVNRWTGEPRVTRWSCVVDAGTIVNATTARSQIVGGVVMGIGQALLEDLRIEPETGRFGNATMADYLVPINADIPPIDVEFLNYPDTLLSDLGARGIGELGNVGAAAAVANAVHNATGKRIRDLPITLDKLL
ncbi:xanthine dehydrogenase family protein molybdopterin-binding subunit [Nonomuraea turkmeniaca]|uniref:xanthine dehydrogenase family protein molybdopterin-binding subunit n=1 Tax=Nonomuraea turkmeniaca TaxID=103838 RepID=UPI001FE87B97|nr:xanthine dehydrogenase family protein molybdopterin-binding subunit [Nonomuraea turkmeniaca]